MPESKESKPYDTTEARAIFLNARTRVCPKEYATEKRKAALSLWEAVLQAARSAEYTVITQGNEADVILPYPRAKEGVWINVDTDAGIVMGQYVENIRGEVHHGEKFQGIAIEYDGSGRAWVGTQTDTYRTPMPGEPVPKRNAVAVVAERIQDALLPASDK